MTAGPGWCVVVYVTWIDFVFTAFTPLFTNNSEIKFRYNCSFCDVTYSDLCSGKAIVTSVDDMIDVALHLVVEISYVYIRYSKGPIILPYVTPASILLRL